MDLQLIGSINWQTVAALACVIAAACVVARRVFGWLNGSRQSACSSCPANQSKPLVPMSSLKLSDSLKERTEKRDARS